MAISKRPVSINRRKANDDVPEVGKRSSKSRPGPKPKGNTRQNLLDVGGQIFHTAGYAATGVQGIVAAAHVPKGSFYNHFETKEGFGAEVIGIYSKRSLDKLRSDMSDSRLAPRQRLIKDFAQRCRAHEAAGCSGGCLFGNLSLEVADHSEVMREGLKSHFQQWRDLLASCIAAAQRDGSIRNPTSAMKLAEFTLNSWEGALLRSRAEKTGEALAVFQHVIFNEVLT
jgi:TetR/AcrR family transcriptional repressor of nem operon